MRVGMGEERGGVVMRWEWLLLVMPCEAACIVGESW